MKFRTLRICLHRGWYRIVCSVSLLLIPLFCGKSNVLAATNPTQQDTKDTVSVKKGDVKREYGTTETDSITKEELRNQTTPGRVIVCAYGTPWRGPSGIEVDVERDSTLSRLTREMIERVREYEKK